MPVVLTAFLLVGALMAGIMTLVHRQRERRRQLCRRLGIIY